ncbi:hypothetical protein HY612_00040 [Candidatus Roizmanbacteria bacterium]|nr:hypothetical protein [Candidatus Roizmanbacteria bacterium]
MELAYRQSSFLHLLPKPDFRTESSPSRTIRNFLNEDFVDTVVGIRSIYIPYFDAAETDLLQVGFNWMKANGRDTASPELIWRKTLEFPFAVGPLTRLANNSGQEPNVAYIPGTPDFRTDIQSLTDDYFWKIRLHSFDFAKQFNPNLESTSRSLRIITQFYSSGVEDYREEAEDLITWFLLLKYRMALLKRLNLPVRL